MLAGVCSQIGGELAIFSTGRSDGSDIYTFLCRVVNDPYDVLGCWFSEKYFLSGTLETGKVGHTFSVLFSDKAENFLPHYCP